MSIKPIDFQVMIPKTPEVSKIQNDQVRHSINANQSQAAEFQVKSENSLKQVYSKDKSQQAAIRDKQEKQKQGSREKKNGQDQRNTSESEDGKLQGIGSKIDIRL